MERVPLLTKDGSHTISIPAMNVTYHSVHGAIQESQHVFINAGFNYIREKKNIEQTSILEVGFGTGLNFLLTAIANEIANKTIYYTAIEPFPLYEKEYHNLNYCSLLHREDLHDIFQNVHASEWNKSLVATEHILIHKSSSKIQTFAHSTPFHIIYYDAFAPSAQPELWTKEIFEILYSLLYPGGILVTYCSKGDVRRAMQAAGFRVEKLPGPPRKREMLRAIKK